MHYKPYHWWPWLRCFRIGQRHKASVRYKLYHWWPLRVLSYSIESHTVSALQTRSLVAVAAVLSFSRTTNRECATFSIGCMTGAADSYCSSLQSVQAVQLRPTQKCHCRRCIKVHHPRPRHFHRRRFHHSRCPWRIHQCHRNNPLRPMPCRSYRVTRTATPASVLGAGGGGSLGVGSTGAAGQALRSPKSIRPEKDDKA